MILPKVHTIGLDLAEPDHAMEELLLLFIYLFIYNSLTIKYPSIWINQKYV